MAEDQNVFVGLDLGTTKICTIVGEFNNNELEIVGVVRLGKIGVGLRDRIQHGRGPQAGH